MNKTVEKLASRIQTWRQSGAQRTPLAEALDYMEFFISETNPAQTEQPVSGVDWQKETWRKDHPKPDEKTEQPDELPYQFSSGLGVIVGKEKYRCRGIEEKPPVRESVKESALYKALWALRHALQVEFPLRLTPTLLLFHNDDYSVFQAARTGWERDSIEFLQSCLKQADAALSHIEDQEGA